MPVFAAYGIENKGENKKIRKRRETSADSIRGGDEGDRTPDLCIANAALSQLSYTPTELNFHFTGLRR